MRRLRDLEGELAAFERQHLRAVTAEQKRQILDLAVDFPALWTAEHSALAIVSAASLADQGYDRCQGAAAEAGPIAHPLAGWCDRDGGIPPASEPGRRGSLSAALHR